MALLEQLQTEMVAAMKAKDELRLSTLRMMKTALKKHEVDSMKPLDESSEMQILNMLIKQRTRSCGYVPERRSSKSWRKRKKPN